MSVSHIMQIKQGLVHLLLQIQSCLAGVQCRFPLTFLWLLFSQKDTKIKKLFLRIMNQKETDKDHLQNPTKHIPKFTCRFMKYTYFRSNAMLKHHGTKKQQLNYHKLNEYLQNPRQQMNDGSLFPRKNANLLQIQVAKIKLQFVIFYPPRCYITMT